MSASIAVALDYRNNLFQWMY
jgi:hypothetical protein